MAPKVKKAARARRLARGVPGKPQQKTCDLASEVDGVVKNGVPYKAFLQEVAAVSAVDLGAVKKGVHALTTVVTRRLREGKNCTVPNLAHLELKTIPAREACTKTIFGKRCQVKACRQKKKVRVTVLKPLRDAAA